MNQRTQAGPADDGMLAVGRGLLYPGLALTSLLVLRGPMALPFGDMLMAGAGFCALLSMNRPARSLPAALYVVAPLLVVGTLISSAASRDPVGSVSIAVRLIYLVVLVPWILVNLLTERRHVVTAFAWFLFGAALCAVGAVAQLAWGDVIPGGAVTVDGRFTGMTTHQNDLAGISCMAAAATLAAVGATIPRGVRIGALAILSASLVGLILSGSVSGLLGLAAAVLYLIVRGTVRFSRALTVTAAGALLMAILLPQLDSIGALNPIERLTRTTGFSASQSEYDTAGTRLELMRLAVEAIGDSPFVGRGMLIADNVLMKRFTVHNNFLGTWTAGGVLVFLGVVIATAIALRFCLSRHSRRDPLHNAVATAVVAALVFAQTAPGFYNRYYWIPVAFAIYLVIDMRYTRSAPTLGPTSTVAQGVARC
ncbi:O-antigen ligase family protein [Mycobacterium sp. LTG2003]